MSTAPAPRVHESVVWRSPRVLPGGDAPALLGFRTDDFMVELEASLRAEPPTTALHLAAPEHWSDTQPPVFAVPAAPTPQPPGELKLYQPAHGRFYLVTAHLCCRRFGFPDRGLSQTESVGFVLRRVEPAGTAAVDPADTDTFVELAWVPADRGAWQQVTDRRALAAGEEVLPLVPTAHQLAGRRSRLLTGLVPVGARERYEARTRTVLAVPEPADADDPLADPHRALLEETVIDAVRQVRAMRTGVAATSDLAEMLLWALVDLVDFVGQVDGADLDEVAATHLTARAQPEPGPTWATVVATVRGERAALLAGTAPSPGLRAVMDDVRALALDALVAGLELYRDDVVTPAPSTGPATATAAGSGPAPDPDPVEGLLYVARCVYRRSDCPVQRPEWVSAPSVPFRLASFFDPDAPTRPIQISLPIDTSQAGLRAFPRNVSVLVSKQLRAQLNQVKGLDNVVGKQSVDLGMLCSLSIPIITICALTLLMVVVMILNVVFFWLPLFKICLPKPGGGD